MIKALLRLSLACSLTVFAQNGTNDVAAATKAEKSRLAEQCVAEALHREIYGYFAERNELLRTALNHSDSCEAARWHAGQVRYQRHWVAVEDVQQLAAADRTLSRYKARRDKISDDVAGNMALANWCMSRGMNDQARAHLSRVVQLDPEHGQARRLLGFVRVDNVWMSREEVDTARARTASAVDALARWKPKLEQLCDRLIDGSVKQREFTAERVRDIEDVAAIPALEAVFSTQNEALALLGLESIQKMNGVEASLSLARHAVFSTHDSVRQAAARALRDRPMDQYVPAMLSAMELPIESQREVLEGPRGRLLYRHSFLREGRDNREIEILETSYRRIKLPGGNRRETRERVEEDIRERAENREAEVEAANQATIALNQRIMTALESATRVQMLATASNWWNWWNQYNEVYIEGEKPITQTTSREQVDVADQSAALNTALAMSASQRVKDCLAAGTIVWTETGPRAIDLIGTGDRVLSKNPETGELAYKPVLGTTIRPSGPLTQIVVGDETFMCSGGHLFWSTGDGWQRARDIKSGTVLHGASGPSEVNYVSTGTRMKTYNLVVGDFHTYFVGKARILSHDNTVRRPTDKTVPGLAAE